MTKKKPQHPDPPLVGVTGDRGITEGLVLLTQILHEHGLAEATEGFLGGTYGYGCHFENSTFFMHPYCWCDASTCPQCGYDAPNFQHKPSGSEVRWYKYIGRCQKIRLTQSWSTIFVSCIHSLGLPPGNEAA